MSSSRGRVLLTCHHIVRHAARARAAFEAAGIEVVVPDLVGQQFSAEDMCRLLPGIDVVIAGDDVIDRSVLETGRADRLRAVVKWGIGTDSIDKAAARDLGMPVYNTPGAFSEEVADAAWALILMLSRGYHRMNESVAAGGWLKVEGRSLGGLTLGVVGLGGIGRAIARRGIAFGMTVVGSDPMAIDPETLASIPAKQLPLEELLATADVVCLACNLTPDNVGLIGDETLALIRPGVWLVNVARGPLVDEAALERALESGRVGAAALDVFEVEPLPVASPLRRFSNVVFGSHNGSNTREAVMKVNETTTRLAIEILEGREPAALHRVV